MPSIIHSFDNNSSINFPLIHVPKRPFLNLKSHFFLTNYPKIMSLYITIEESHIIVKNIVEKNILETQFPC